jgi:hypothetical protein
VGDRALSRRHTPQAAPGEVREAAAKEAAGVSQAASEARDKAHKPQAAPGEAGFLLVTARPTAECEVGDGALRATQRAAEKPLLAYELMIE